MMERTVPVSNELGLHARPAAAFVKTAARFSSKITVAKDRGAPINGKSILGLMTLAAERGSVLTICAEGEDAEETLNALVGLVERGFEG